MRSGYRNSGCFDCRHRQITIIPHCSSSYSNVVNTVKVYCKKRKQLVNYPHERCMYKTEREVPAVRLDQW